MRMDCEKNYYAILGVRPDASAEEIDEQYIKLSSKRYPSTNSAMMTEIKEAYEIIGKKNTRMIYNRLCILDLEKECKENTYYVDISFEEEESTKEKRNFLDIIKRSFFYEELNNPYRDNSYNPNYQRIEDGKYAIYDKLDIEKHYIEGFETEIKDNKDDIIYSYDYDKLTERLRRPFYNRALKLAEDYNFNLKNDSKYLKMCDDITISLHKTLYTLSRLLEKNSYAFLYNISNEYEFEFFIERVDDLYNGIFELIGMTPGESLFFKSFYNTKKNLTKFEKKIMDYKYEICMCYECYHKLARKIKIKKQKALVKTK